MFGVENQRRVERLGERLIGLLAGEHIAVVGRMAQGRIRRDGFLSQLQAGLRGDDGRHLRCEVFRFAQVVRRTDVLRAWVQRPEHRHRCAQPRHGMRRGRRSAQHIDDLPGDGPPASQITAERAQLIGSGNPVMPDQKSALLEGQGLRNVMDSVAAQGQLGDRPIDVGNTRIAGQYTFEPGKDTLGCLAPEMPLVCFAVVLCILCLVYV